MAQSQGKPPEATCPHCGSPMGKSPAGQQILQRASQQMAQRRGPRGPQGSAGQGAVDPRRAILQRLLAARQGGGGMPQRPPGF